jgi:hypothetical protein
MIGMRAILSAIDRHLLWIPNAFRVVAGALAVGAAIRWVLEEASGVHLAFAGVLAVAFITAALWLTHRVRRTRCPADCTGALGVLALGLLTTMVVSAWASFAIQTSGIGSYAVPDGYSPSTFVDFYMYVFADILPGMEPLRTLRIAVAVEPQDWVAGLPVLGFKLYVLWLFVGAYRSWWRATKRAAA